MKNPIIMIIAGTLTLGVPVWGLAGDAVTHAIEPVTPSAGFYAEAFGGVSFFDDLSGTGGAALDADFDTGWTAGGTFGHAFAPGPMGYFAMEIEGAYGQSDLDGLAINGNTIQDVDGDLGMTQTAVNFLYHFDRGGMLVPYVGAGIGAGFVNADFQYPGVALDDEDAAFYYQFIGGVSLVLNEKTSLFAEYRYGTMEEFELDRAGGSVVFDELAAHQAIFGVRIRF